MNLEFPLCREPRHEERIRPALEECVRFLTQRLPARALVAVVLTGSFARGEGSVLPLGDALKVLGDVEFFVVLTSEPEVRRRCRQFTAWGHEASAGLAARGVRAEVEFGPLDLAFFGRRARPSIFVHDLRQHGKVLWGPGDVLDAIPPFEPYQIPREDALHLTFNRTIEQLATYDRVSHLAGDALLDASYQRLKLTLDLAGSALAFTGTHTALYHRRPAAFARLLAETPSLQTRLPGTFLDDLERAARAKIDPADHLDGPPAWAALETQREWLRRQALTAVPAVAGLLRWELEQLLGVSDDLPPLLRRYARTRPFGRRLWDWAKIALNPMPAPLPISPRRAARLFWISTPRALLYAAGASAYLALGRSCAALDEIAHLLPLSGAVQPRDATGQRQTIVALWRWCVRNT